MERLHLLSLPREIRDIIIRHYVFDADGYHFNPTSRKLRTRCGKKLDLALMYCCKQLAAEMRFTALENNTLHFFPYDVKKQRRKAGHFDIVMREMDLARVHAVRATMHPELRSFRTEEIEAEVALKFPQMRGLLRIPAAVPFNRWDSSFEENFIFHNWGVPPSVARGYLLAMTRALVTASPGFLQALGDWQAPRSDWFRLRNQHINGDELLARQTIYKDCYQSPSFLTEISPWKIPSEQEVASLYQLFKFDSFFDRLERWTRWRFSAAAVAIQFLDSFPDCHARSIVLHEDLQSVARPECHAQGLIPFCRANPRLRIERRVSIWNNILPSGSNTPLPTVLSLNQVSHPHPRDDHLLRLEPEHVSRAFMPWIVEASLLVSAAGMPSGSFNLVLDAGDFGEQSTELFELLKLDAARGVAWKRHCTNQLGASGLGYNGNTICDEFSKAIESILAGDSIVTCNFPLNPSDQETYANSVLTKCQDLLSEDEWLQELKPEYDQIGRTACKVPPSLAKNWVELQLQQLDVFSVTFRDLVGLSICGLRPSLRGLVHYVTGGIFDHLPPHNEVR